MGQDVVKLVEDALKLPAEARAALAGKLIESLDAQADEAAEAAWKAEITRRLQHIDSGQVKTVPWDEARRQIVGTDDSSKP